MTQFATDSVVDVRNIVARIERLPLSRWLIKVRVIIGTATFFDAFDSLSIAYALPVLIGMWSLKPSQIGYLISIGFVGQLLGAVLFGWLAERIGRVRATTYCVAIFSLMSLVCIAVQSYEQLLVCRFIQGIGLGGEVPIAGAYISELSRSDKRGRFFMLYELVFPIGFVLVALLGAWVVPRFGWQWLFVIGGVPALLALHWIRRLPESPRWLSSKGRLSEADAALSHIERAIEKEIGKPLLPAAVNVVPETREVPTSWLELLGREYRKRTLTVWGLWFFCYVVVYGMTAWLPSLYRTLFKLPVQDALIYGLITSMAGLVGNAACAFLIDWMGRRRWFAMSFSCGALPLIVLALIPIDSATQVVVLVSISYGFIASIASSLYLYTPEIYPTRMRALGGGVATAWLRLASILGPFMVGAVLPVFGLSSVFMFFAASAVAGAFVTLFFAVETKGQQLEKLSP